MQTKTLVSEPLWKKYLKICMTKVPKNQRYVVSFKILLFSPVCCKKNWKSLDLGFVILLNNKFLSFFCKLLQGNMMIGCRVMTKMQRPLIAMNFSLLLLSLFRIIKKERKINKILFVNMFSIYLFMC